MRVRSGFVSNSSSSSFIILTDEEDHNALVQSIIAKLPKIYQVTEGDTPSHKLLESLFENEVDDVIYNSIERRYEFDDDELSERVKMNLPVYELTLEDYGDGGTTISTLLRRSFPEGYEDDEISIRRSI